MILMVLLSSLLCLFTLRPTLIVDLGYYTRPIWDKNPNEFQVIPHYYAEDVPLDDLCRLHDWQPKTDTTARVYDAIIFSVELDILEIRIRELWEVVDVFVILESNATFTGKPKPLTFNAHKDRFAFASSKIRHVTVDQYPLPSNEGPFFNEGQMRDAMNEALVEAGVQTGDLVIMSDVDEIVRAQTLRVLKSCEGVPEKLHLQLKSYLYSFEFYLDLSSSWRAHVVKYVPGKTFYTHGQISEYILSDAGWHCSFCFRTIEEFQFKMTSYSHSDRLRYPELLYPDRIQQIICSGEDIFDMPPEAYSYKDMISKLGAIESLKSAVGLPSSLLKHAEQFKFLLPGGCIRDKNT
ncbi:MAG: beta-1,4-N-acetylglucosaminyltransferase-like protein [Benjaminiella poitrasii]|nr:MAG: beta-1,4-N-acetylglucosaminyltransferase-like protein [Benjaminiella poitrasii]